MFSSAFRGLGRTGIGGGGFLPGGGAQGGGGGGSGGGGRESQAQPGADANAGGKSQTGDSGGDSGAQSDGEGAQTQGQGEGKGGEKVEGEGQGGDAGGGSVTGDAGRGGGAPRCSSSPASGSGATGGGGSGAAKGVVAGVGGSLSCNIERRFTPNGLVGRVVKIGMDMGLSAEQIRTLLGRRDLSKARVEEIMREIRRGEVAERLWREVIGITRGAGGSTDYLYVTGTPPGTVTRRRLTRSRLTRSHTTRCRGAPESGRSTWRWTQRGERSRGSTTCCS